MLLDVMFDKRVQHRELYWENFSRSFQLSYSHNLDEKELQRQLQSLCQNDYLIKSDSIEIDNTFYQITVAGGNVWTQERCPIWVRYLTTKYSVYRTREGQGFITAIGGSLRVVEDFLNLYPYPHALPTRKRIKTINDRGILSWRRFETLYTGTAMYQAMPSRIQLQEQHVKWDADRSWWYDVGSLQRFITTI